MARQVTVRYIDDVNNDREADLRGLILEWNGRRVSLDLNAQTVETLDEVLGAYLDAGEPVKIDKRSKKPRTKHDTTRVPQQRKPAVMDRVQRDEIRRWAREKVHQVPERGRIKQSIVDDWHKAHPVNALTANIRQLRFVSR